MFDQLIIFFFILHNIKQMQRNVLLYQKLHKAIRIRHWFIVSLWYE